MVNHFQRALKATNKLKYWLFGNIPGLFVSSVMFAAVFEYTKIHWWAMGINYFDYWEKKHLPELLAKKELEIKEQTEKALQMLDDDLKRRKL